jgi:hypothetical protein
MKWRWRENFGRSFNGFSDKRWGALRDRQFIFSEMFEFRKHRLPVSTLLRVGDIPVCIIAAGRLTTEIMWPSCELKLQKPKQLPENFGDRRARRIEPARSPINCINQSIGA